MVFCDVVSCIVVVSCVVLCCWYIMLSWVQCTLVCGVVKCGAVVLCGVVVSRSAVEGYIVSWGRGCSVDVVLLLRWSGVVSWDCCGVVS